MKQSVIKKEDNMYKLNEFQHFYVNTKKIKEALKNISFPAIVMDTEFFNKSHDTPGNTDVLYNTKESNIVYVLQYSLIKNFEDLNNRENKNHIKSLRVKRALNNNNFNFSNQYSKMINNFINFCLKSNAKTIIFAGEFSDVKIIQYWLKKKSQLLLNKKTELFKYNKETKEYDINSFDIYNVLEPNFSFSNFDKEGKEFYNPKNLKKGKVGENTIQLTSLKKFFDYMNEVYEENFDEDKDIYALCKSALKLFSKKMLTHKEYVTYNNDVKQAINHCYNDVLKLCYLIQFVYIFSGKESKNKFLIQEGGK